MCAYTCICESQSACSASSKLRFFASSSFIMHNGMSSSSIVPAWSMAIFDLRHAECAPNAAAAAIAVASALRRMVVSFCRVGGSVLNEDRALPMTAGLTTSESSLFRSLFLVQIASDTFAPITHIFVATLAENAKKY